MKKALGPTLALLWSQYRSYSKRTDINAGPSGPTINP